MSWAHESIDSKEWDTAWRIRGLNGRSEPSVGTITELPSWMPMGTCSSSAASHTGSYAGSESERPMQGLGLTKADLNPSSCTDRRSSCAAAAGSCMGSMAEPNSRAPSAAQ